MSQTCVAAESGFETVLSTVVDGGGVGSAAADAVTAEYRTTAAAMSVLLSICAALSSVKSQTEHRLC